MDNMSNQTPEQAPAAGATSKKKKVILSVVGALVVVVIVIGTILTLTHLNKGSQSETPDPTPSQQIEQVEPTISPEESDDTLNGIDNIVNSGVADIEEIGPDGIILGKDKDGNQVLEVLPDPDSEEFKKALAEADAMLNAALKGEPLTPTTPETPEQTPQPSPPPAAKPAPKPVTPPPATTDSGSNVPDWVPGADNTGEDIVIAPGTGDVKPLDPNSPTNGLYWE